MFLESAGYDRNRLYLLLNSRMAVLGLHRQCCNQASSSGTSERKAQCVVLAKVAAEILEKTADDKPDTTPAGMLVDLAQILREGERWQDLVDTFGAKEVLLIGTKDAADMAGPEYSDILDSDLTLGEALEQSPADVDLDKLMREGSDSLFKELKQYLLRPEVRFKETCHRLNGLYDMVLRLKDLEDDRYGKYGDNNQPDLFARLRQKAKDNNVEQERLSEFLSSEITKRIEEVLGEPEKKEFSEDEESEVNGSDLESGGEADDDSVAHSDHEH